MTNFKTKHGFNDDEVFSALQKQIRRGIEDDALYFALEICDNGQNKNGFYKLRNKLLMIAYEDIGLGNPDVVLQVSLALRDMERMYKSENDGWKLILAHTILILSRTEKSKISDHFQKYVEYIWEKKTPEEMEVEIPDYALDINTSKGNKMGRKKGSLKGLEHFIEFSEKLENENPDVNNIYKKEVYKILKEEKK